MDVTRTIRDLSELDKDTRAACEEFLRRAKAAGLPVRITETYRPQERQDYLYEQGRSRPGKKVTWTRSSYHTTRRAFDFCRNVKGREYDDSDGFFRKCAEIGKSLGLNCGYFWKDYQDKPHMQLDKGKKYKPIEKTNAFPTGVNNSADNLSSGKNGGLNEKIKRDLMADGILRYSEATADYILAFPKYGAELARKILSGEPMGDGARRYLLAHRYGAEMVRRADEKKKAVEGGV